MHDPIKRIQREEQRKEEWRRIEERRERLIRQQIGTQPEQGTQTQDDTTRTKNATNHDHVTEESERLQSGKKAQNETVRPRRKRGEDGKRARAKDSESEDDDSWVQRAFDDSCGGGKLRGENDSLVQQQRGRDLEQGERLHDRSRSDSGRVDSTGVEGKKRRGNDGETVHGDESHGDEGDEDVAVSESGEYYDVGLGEDHRHLDGVDMDALD